MSWKGGQTVCPNLKLVFIMQLGDIIMLRSSILEHYIIPWAEGNRISCVFWMHKGMLNWKTLEVIHSEMPVPRPREQLPIVMRTRTSLPELMAAYKSAHKSS